jgi:toxin ParE1/3/4
LNRIYDFIAEFAGVDSGWQAAERIKARCLTLTTFPNRGTPHPELLEGLRTIPHGKAVIAYRVEPDAVVVCASAMRASNCARKIYRTSRLTHIHPQRRNEGLPPSEASADEPALTP